MSERERELGDAWLIMPEEVAAYVLFLLIVFALGYIIGAWMGRTRR